MLNVPNEARAQRGRVPQRSEERRSYLKKKTHFLYANKTHSDNGTEILS